MRLVVALSLALARTSAAPERVEDLVRNRDTPPHSFAHAISILATEHLATSAGAPPKELGEQRVAATSVKAEDLIARVQPESPLQQHLSDSNSPREDQTSRFPLLVAALRWGAKHTVNAAANSVQPFAEGGIPGKWLAILMMLTLVAIFLFCWCARSVLAASMQTSRSCPLSMVMCLPCAGSAPTACARSPPSVTR